MFKNTSSISFFRLQIIGALFFVAIVVSGVFFWSSDSQSFYENSRPQDIVKNTQNESEGLSFFPVFGSASLLEQFAGPVTNAFSFSGNLSPEDFVRFPYFNMQEDDSLQKFVSPWVSFLHTNYHPEKLVFVEGKNLRSIRGALVSEVILDPLNRLANAFYNEFQVPFFIASGFRSFEKQEDMRKKGCSETLCAKEGHSEHQTGLAIDIFGPSTDRQFLANVNYRKYFAWLQEHAHEYGFHNSYQKGLETDGYEKEPWHWRYLGPVLATKLKNEGITFTEYYLSRQ